MSRLFGFLALVTLAAFASTVSATVASQFRLNPSKDVSKCFVECHIGVTTNLEVDWALNNSPSYITKNCETQEYVDALVQCIPRICQTSWDAEYAVEYGSAFCKKAGVNVDFALPVTYTSTAGGYFATALAENFVTSGAESLRTSFMLAVVAGLVALKVLL